MSGDIKHEKNVGPNDPAYYAPRELRDRPTGALPDPASAQGGERRPRPAEGPATPPAGLPQRSDHSEIFTRAVAQVLKEQMQSGPVEAPSVLRGTSGSRLLLMQTARLFIAVAISASVALLLVMAIPALQRPADSSVDTSSLFSAWQSLKSAVLPAAQPKRVATLSVQEGRGLADEPLPLGIHVGDPPTDASVTISGLPANARLTSGRRVSAGEWRVPASEVSVVSVIPPDGFVGQMQLTAELRDGGGAALTASSTRLSWAAPVRAPAAPPVAPPAAPVAAAAPVVAAPAPVAALSAPQSEQVRNLDPRDVAALVRRGQDLLAGGDVQSARLLLQRAAEARDARAALLYGKTYDPAVLRQIGASGPLVDVAQARLWYQRAREWGEPEAQRQLDALASSR